MVGTWNVLVFLRERIDGIVHGKHLLGVLMVLLNNRAAGQFGHAHDAVGIIHTVLLHRIDGRIDFSARTVKVRSMDMDTERLSAHHLGMHSGRIRQPVVGMNNIKFLLASHYSGNHREVVYLFVQVAGITASKVHAAYVIDVHIREIRINMVAERIIIFRRHVARQPRLQIIVIDITPHDRHLVHAHYLQEVLFFARRLGHAESSFHITLQT